MREWSSSSERKWINGCPIHVERCSFITVEYNTHASQDRKPPASVLKKHVRHTEIQKAVYYGVGKWTPWQATSVLANITFANVQFNSPTYHDWKYSCVYPFTFQYLWHERNSNLSLEDIDWNELGTKKKRSGQCGGKTRNNLKPRI